MLPSVAANLGTASLGDDAEQLGRLRRLTWARNQTSLLRVADVVDALSVLDRPPMLCKGAALCATVHEAGARTMGDIDLVVGPDQLEQAVELLATAGWRARPAPAMQPFDHAITLTDADGRELDIHRWLLRTKFSRAPEDGLFDRAEPLDLSSSPCTVPSAADSIVIAVVSGSTAGDFSSIRWPVDVRALVRHLHAYFGARDDVWDAVVAAALDLRLGPIVARGLDWARVELGFDVPRDAIARLDDGGLDRVSRAEWWLRRQGIGSTSRVRRYVDSSRAIGARPSPREYTSARWEAIGQHGSVTNAIRSRVSRVAAASRYYRGAR